MMIFPLFLLLMQAEPREEGFVLERDVKLVLLDVLDRKKEIHRRERVLFQGGNLLVEDLTFGEKLLVRSDLKTVWVVDSLAGTYSKIGFDQIRKRQAEVLGEIAHTRKRIAGTEEEKSLRKLLEGYGRFDVAPKVEIRIPGKTKKILDRDCVRKDLYWNGNIRRLSVYVAPNISSKGYFDTLSKIGAFTAEETKALRELGGVPMSGVMRYVFFLDRVRAQIQVDSVRVENLPADTFSPPTEGKEVLLAGFSKVPPREIKRPEGFERSFREDDLEVENDAPEEGDNR